MFGFGSQAAAQPPVDPSATPPAQAPQQGPLLPGQPGYTPSKVDMLLDMIWNGHSPMDASSAVRGRDAAVYQQQLMRQMYTKAQQDDPSGHELAAMLFNSPEYGKAVSANFAPVSTAAGATQTMFGGPTVGGNAFVAPEFYRDDKSGTVGVQTQNGNVRQDQLGGDFTAKDGLILSGRQGVLGTYSTPQTIAPGSTGVPFSPSVNGAGAGAPVISGQFGSSQGPAPTAPATAASVGGASGALPRGLRNNNPGNLSALPSGHMWDGQTGFDAGGDPVFATPQDGMKAAATNLGTYATRHGLNTVAGVISRWAPDKNLPNYVNFVSGRMGVSPNQKLDMSDPRVQHGLLSGIFSFENGPKVMAGWQPQAAAARATQTASASPASGAGYGQPFAQGRQPRLLSPTEAQAAGFAPGAVVEQGADGKFAVTQSPEYGPEAKSSLRNHVLTSDEYKQAQASQAAYKAMIANAATMTGPGAYSMLDTFARAINPGAVARPTVIQTLEHSLGPLNGVEGGWDRVLGQGNLTPQVRQQIIDAVVPFAQAHWDQAKMLNDSNAELAKSHGFKAEDVTAPMDERPQRMIAAPDGAISEAQALAQARQAIKAGAPRDKVIGRLQALHIRPAGL